MIELGHINDEALVARFWKHVATGKTDECWEWIGGARDYKNFGIGNGTVLAHRFSKSIQLGYPVSEAECVLHSCDNPPCVNPSHLFIGTKQDNALDAVRKGRWHRNRGRAKVTEEMVKEIRRLYAIPKWKGFSERLYPTTRLGKMFNMTPQNISDIVARRTWKDVC